MHHQTISDNLQKGLDCENNEEGILNCFLETHTKKRAQSFKWKIHIGLSQKTNKQVINTVHRHKQKQINKSDVSIFIHSVVLRDTFSSVKAKQHFVKTPETMTESIDYGILKSDTARTANKADTEVVKATHDLLSLLLNNPWADSSLN